MAAQLAGSAHCAARPVSYATLKQLHPDLWIVDHPFRIGGLNIGTRTTVVRLEGGLWMHSPGPLTPELKAGLEALGPMRAIVAPNTMHYYFFEENREAFPEAEGWGCEALLRKAPRLPIDHILQADSGFQLESVLIEGVPELAETVFYHRPSQTLITTDLVFNIPKSGGGKGITGWWTRAFMKLNGAYARFGPSRIFRHLALRDGRALGRSIAKILEWDIQRIIMGHGEVLEKDGHQALCKAFAWLPGGLPPSAGKQTTPIGGDEG